MAKTLRTSLRADASPTSGPTGVTGIPSAPMVSAKRSAPGPDTSAGVASPRPGTAPSSATSANVAPPPATASAAARLTAGAAVLRSANSAPESSPGAALSAASTATAAELRLSTISAPRAASASPVGRLYAVGRVAHGVPAAHRRAGRHEIGGDGAARLAKPDHGDDAGSAHPAVLASTAGDCSGRTIRSTSRR